MDLLTGIGLRQGYTVDRKQGPGEYRLTRTEEYPTVAVAFKDRERVIEVPSPETVVIDVNERTCTCSLSSHPITEDDIPSMKGCHHLRFADVGLQAAPETVRRVPHRFGIRLGSVFETLNASTLAEAQTKLQHPTALPVYEIDPSEGLQSAGQSVKIDPGRIEDSAGTGSTPHHSQRLVQDAEDTYWIVHTQRDLLGDI